MIDQSIRSSGEPKHPECPVHPFAADANEHTVICFVRRPWLVLNQGLANSLRLATKGQSTGWEGGRRASVVVGNTSDTRKHCAKLSQQKLFETPVI